MILTTLNTLEERFKLIPSHSVLHGFISCLLISTLREERYATFQAVQIQILPIRFGLSNTVDLNHVKVLKQAKQIIYIL
jgi:hypothetical protein